MSDSPSPKKRRRLLPIILVLVGACLVLAIVGALLLSLLPPSRC